MAASGERAAPVFIGLPFGSVAAFLAAVACGHSHPAVALLLVAGVVALTRQIAVEWGPRGVRANIVSPGLIRTPMSAASYEDPDMLARRQATTALNRIGEPEDVAEAVAWLVDDRSHYFTGQEIVVDGGFLHTALMRVQAR